MSAPQPPEIAQAAKPADKATEKKPAEKKADVPVVAGWNGEHLSSRAPTASFKCSRTGTFSLITAPTRVFVDDAGIVQPRHEFAQSGRQEHVQTRLPLPVEVGQRFLDKVAQRLGVVDALRDLYVNIKPNPAFLFQVGQYKEPFAQELLTSAPNLDFVERSLASLLYPSAATAYRSPGATPDRRLYLACQAVNKGGGTREVSRGVANFWL